MNRSFKIEEIESVVKEFLEDIKSPQPSLNKEGVNAIVLGFSGNLGAGKTTFTKEILKQLGHNGNVASPTFVLRRDYEIKPHPNSPINRGGVVRNVIHIDAYRLENPEHIYQVISKGELGDKNNLIIIEWPEKVSKDLFDKVFLFEHVDEDTRKISLK
jgi:tRNA threonylcarbamoyladenosine biosynthesis protein TsaE